MRNLRKALWLLRKGHLRPLLRRLRRFAWHDGVATLGLAYDPRAPVAVRVPRAPVQVRPIQDEDAPAFTAMPPAGDFRADALTRASARNLLGSGLQTCYVGVTEDGPVYMQFLVTAGENERLAEVFGGLFPPLADDEGLLEFAFTLQQHRARPVMPGVLLRLIDIAREQGLRRVVTYVRVDNPRFMRFYLRLGFAPFVVRLEKWRLFHRTVEFRPLEPGDVEQFQKPGGAEGLVRSSG